MIIRTVGAGNLNGFGDAGVAHPKLARADSGKIAIISVGDKSGVNAIEASISDDEGLSWTHSTLYDMTTTATKGGYACEGLSLCAIGNFFYAIWVARYTLIIPSTPFRVVEYAKYDGSSWGAATILELDGTNLVPGECCISAGSSGGVNYVDMVWETDDGFNGVGIGWERLTDDSPTGGGFKVKACPVAGDDYSAPVCFTYGSTVHILASEITTDPVDFHVEYNLAYLTRSVSGTWSAQEVLEMQTTAHYYDYSLAVLDSKVHAIWIGNPYFQTIKYCLRDGSWGSVATWVTDATESLYRVSISTDGTFIYAAWDFQPADSYVGLRKYNGAVWSDIVNLLTSGESNFNILAVAGDNYRLAFDYSSTIYYAVLEDGDPFLTTATSYAQLI